MNEEVKALKSELALLKLQFSERVGAVEHRLNTLLAQNNIQGNIQAEQQHQNITQAEEKISFIQQEKAPEVVSKTTRTISANEYLASRKAWEEAAPAKPSFITILFQTILSSLFDWLSPVTKIYQSYKERGMLGIFILTMVGIGLTLAGFGYLMQLLIDQLGAGSKSLLMCIVAMLVMGLGIGLKIKTRFSEFATAIVALGILLSYSTVYFSGSIYGILPSIVMLTLYLAIALVCHTLALWLDTKVIAALGIIGIATMPILSNTLIIEPIYYLLSLAFVVASSLILAYRHVGQWLANLSLAFTVVAIEWLMEVDSVHISAWAVDLFYLLFFTYIAISLLKEKNSQQAILIFLATLLGSTVLMFYQASDLFSHQMSFSFALNATIAAGVATIFYKIKHPLTHFIILLCALWVVLAIVSAISNAYWGIAWAIEGLLLLYIGRKYLSTFVINQGQILTAIALVYSWSALAVHFPLPALKSTDGWVLSIVIVTVIAIWQRFITNNDVFDAITQRKIKPLLQLLEVIWLSVLLIASSNIWLGNLTGAIIILLQLALLFRAKKCKQLSIEIFSAALILVPLFYVFKGVLLVDSYRFMLLPLFAKLAIISAFSQLWLWSAFYRKYHPNSAIKAIAESVRILFYLLLPICWVGSVIRRFDDEALMILWLSPLMALFLARKVNHHLLFKEVKILTALASLFFVVFVGQLSLTNSAIAFIGFTSFYAIAYTLNRKESVHIYPFICSFGIFSLGFAFTNIVGFYTSSIFYAMIVATLYWAIAFNALNVSAHLKRNEIAIITINLLLVIGAWLLMASNTYYTLVPIIFLAAALYQKENKFRHSLLGKTLQLNSDLFLHSIVAITYVTLLASLAQYRLDLWISPALAVHGALILFLKDRRITTVKYSFGLILLGIIKLAMIDAANALLWQKVMLFMGIGIFILAASFWYQKLVSKTEVTNALG